MGVRLPDIQAPIAQLTSIAADLTTCMRALQARQDSFLTLKGEASSPTVHIHGHAIGDQGTGSDHEI